MAECGICLDVLRNPVCLPCGHIHCERCLRGHVGSGTDALRSTCPTCRKPFHIATPDFTFVPQKYHDFIQPTVRKVYMDIPSVAVMTREVEALTRRLDAFAKDNEHLRQRCTQYKERLGGLESEKAAVTEHEAEARQETLNLRKKYDSLKKKYREALRSCDCYAPPSQNLSRRSSQNFDTCRDILPKVEEHPVSLQDLAPNPPRPKRALPKRLSGQMHPKEEAAPQLVKRQRIYRHSDIGSSSQLRTCVFKGEDEEDE